MAGGKTPDDSVSPESEDWVLLASYGTDGEARLVEGMLESEGIECALESRLFRQEPVALGLLGTVRLFVREADVTRARLLLEDSARAEPEDDDRAIDDG